MENIQHSSESSRNQDISFLYRQFDITKFGLSIWISNDNFAEEIRSIERSGKQVTAFAVYMAMQKTYSACGEEQIKDPRSVCSGSAERAYKQIGEIAWAENAGADCLEPVAYGARRNEDLSFLFRKLDWGSPYLSLSYWIENDRFASRIREMMRDDSDVTNESVLLVMRELYVWYRCEWESGRGPDFNFSLARKVMLKLESAAQIEPWHPAEWAMLLPGYEDLSYIREILVGTDLQFPLVRSIFRRKAILDALRESGTISTPEEIFSVIKDVQRKSYFSRDWENPEKKGEYFALRGIVAKLRSTETDIS